MSAGFVLRQASVLDASGRFEGPLDVRVRGGVVEAVGRDLPADGLASFDLAGTFLMPGVADCHAHPSMTVRDPLAALRLPITAWAVAAADGLRRTLHCGVTLLRDAGGTDPGLRQAIAAGHAEGPQLQLSIVLLSQTGGQMDGYLAGPGIELATSYYVPEYPGRPQWLADGVDEVRRAARQVLRAGGDWIKLCAGSGPHVEGQTFGHDEYSAAEIAVAVEEAARRGRFVMADSKTPTSIETCVLAGVRSIEHGVFLDEERARLMAEHGTWLVPTHAVYRDAVAQADAGLIPEAIGSVFRSMLHESRDLVRIARAAGVRIALGSDAFGAHMLGTNLVELAYLGEAGMPPEEVLLTATLHGAQLCGVAERYGRIDAGYVFDAIVLDEDPSDLEVFRRPDAVTGVFQAGRARVLHPRLGEEGGMASELLRQALGTRVRTARHERAMSLRELAARSGVSKALLSTIERGDGNPSVETLFRLGTALGLPISQLVMDEDDGGPEIVRAGDGRLVSWVDRPIEVRLIFTSSGHRRIELYECEMPPGSRSQWDSSHGDGVSEFITIREGQALAGPVGGEERLGPGDAIVLRPGAAHAIEALDEPVRFNSVIAYPY